MLTLSLRCVQAFDGAPVVAQGTVSTNDPNTDLANSPHVFLGVTSTSTPPATYAGLAAHDNGGGTSDVYSTPLWDTMAYAQNLTSSGGASGPNRAQFLLNVLKRLGTFTAGQYLWLWVSTGAAYPSSGEAPAALAGPYLVH